MIVPFLIAAGVLLATLALPLIISGWRGRVVSDEPRCRPCAFDLTGLTLDAASVCPECGAPLDSAAVIYGTRKRRPVRITAGFAVLLLGTTLAVSPFNARLRSITQFNPYTVLPDRAIVTLSKQGNHRALDEAGDRLIDGTLSVTWTQDLSDHALTLQAGSAPWDTRWGNVLVAAFFDETLTDAQLDTYLDRMMSFRLAAHSEIGTNDKEMHAEIVSVASPRGAFDQRFVSRFGDARQLQLTNGEDSQYRVWIEIHWAKDLESGVYRPSERPTIQSGIRDPGIKSFFLPYQTSFGSRGTEVFLDEAPERFGIDFKVVLNVAKGGDEVYRKERILTKQIRRVESPVRVIPMKRNHNLTAAINAIEARRVIAIDRPEELTEGLESGSVFTQNLWMTANGDLEVGLLGHIDAVVRDQRIRLGYTAKPRLRDSWAILNYRNHPAHHPDHWLKRYTEHPEFWEAANARGAVDLYYVPDPELAKDHPQVTRYIADPIIWNDVPVARYEPVKDGGYSSTGITIYNSWTLEPVNRPEPGVAYTPEEYAALTAPPPPIQGRWADDALVEP